MLFNFVIVGSTAERLAALDDTLRPIFFGLRALGHRVMSVGRNFEPRPAVNIIVADDGAGSSIAARARAEGGKAACIGLLCPDEPTVEDARVAKTADFIWTCSPAAAIAPERQAVISFGFDPAMLGTRLEREPVRRDGGVIVYGEEGERSTLAEQALTKAGTPVLFARASHFPDYIVSDLLGRAALAVVVRRDADDRTPPSMRIAKALCHGALVVAEASAPGDLSLAPYVTECAFDEIPARCLSLLKEGPVPRGLDALERYRRETSMAKGLEAAVRVAQAAAGGR
jgi:hypothetical protein